MNKLQFIAGVEAKSNFKKWAEQPVLVETIGDVEKWRGLAFVSTPDGTNTFNVWFIVDKATGEATWQNQDTMTPEANTNNAVLDALIAYCKSTFVAYFVKRYDVTNKWAEVDTYAVSGTDLAATTVLVYKQGSNPVTHKKIV